MAATIIVCSTILVALLILTFATFGVLNAMAKTVDNSLMSVPTDQIAQRLQEVSLNDDISPDQKNDLMEKIIGGKT